MTDAYSLLDHWTNADDGDIVDLYLLEWEATRRQEMTTNEMTEMILTGGKIIKVEFNIIEACTKDGRDVEEVRLYIEKGGQINVVELTPEIDTEGELNDNKTGIVMTAAAADLTGGLSRAADKKALKRWHNNRYSY